jgi:hypothetical protein
LDCWHFSDPCPCQRHFQFPTPFDNDLSVRWLSYLVSSLAHPIFAANLVICLIWRGLFKFIESCKFLILCSAYILCCKSSSALTWS